MNPMQNVKFVSLTPPAAIKDNASFATAEIDTKGWDYLTVMFQVGATDVAMAALKLTECDTTGGSFADVTGAIWGTSTDCDGTTTALPSATDDNKFELMHVDLRKRKRFFELVATAGDGTTGTYGYAVAILSRGEHLPATSAEMGAEHAVII